MEGSGHNSENTLPTVSDIRVYVLKDHHHPNPVYNRTNTNLSNFDELPVLPSQRSYTNEGKEKDFPNSFSWGVGASTSYFTPTLPSFCPFLPSSGAFGQNRMLPFFVFTNFGYLPSFHPGPLAVIQNEKEREEHPCFCLNCKIGCDPCLGRYTNPNITSKLSSKEISSEPKNSSSPEL